MTCAAAAEALKVGWWTRADGRVLVWGLPLPNYWVWGKVYTTEIFFGKYRCKTANLLDLGKNNVLNRLSNYVDLTDEHAVQQKITKLSIQFTFWQINLMTPGHPKNIENRHVSAPRTFESGVPRNLLPLPYRFRGPC